MMNDSCYLAITHKHLLLIISVSSTNSSSSSEVMETDPTAPTQADSEPEAQGMHPMSMMNDSFYLAITFLSSHHKHLPVSHLLTVLVIMDKQTIQKMNPTKLLDFVQSKLMVPLDRSTARPR
jgi:hypothetical protein